MALFISYPCIYKIFIFHSSFFLLLSHLYISKFSKISTKIFKFFQIFYKKLKKFYFSHISTISQLINTKLNKYYIFSSFMPLVPFIGHFKIQNINRHHPFSSYHPLAYPSHNCSFRCLQHFNHHFSIAYTHCSIYTLSIHIYYIDISSIFIPYNDQSLHLKIFKNIYQNF